MAVTGIAGAAVIYTIFAVVLTCCLAGVTFFAFLGLVLDVAFVGAFIAIAVLLREGANSCTGLVNTPLGEGQANSNTGQGFGPGGLGTDSSQGQNVTYSVTLGTACTLNTAAFAVAIIGALIFLLTAAMQIFLKRSHAKEKRYGPSPDNNYTSGPGRRKFWQRKSKKNNKNPDEELGAYGAGVAPATLAANNGHDMRPSHETGYTGTTVGHSGDATYDKVDPVHGNHAPHGAHGGYYTQPQGTGVNPYGYSNTGTATNY